MKEISLETIKALRREQKELKAKRKMKGSTWARQKQRLEESGHYLRQKKKKKQLRVIFD